MTPQMMDILHRISLLHDPEPETVFQKVAEAAAEVYPTAMVMVNLIDGDCLRFRTVVRTHPAFVTVTQLEMKATLCQFALSANSPLLIQNAEDTVDFCHHAVVGLKLRRYLGVPISNARGEVLGTFCFLDDQVDSPLEPQDTHFFSLLAMRIGFELERERLETEWREEQALRQRQEEAQRQEREAFLTSAARFKAFVDCTADAVIAFDKQGRITDWNQGATQLFGYTEEEAIGESYTLLGTPEVHSFQHQVFTNTLHGVTHQWYDTRRRQKSGNVIDVSITTSPYQIDGEVKGLVAIVRDITEKVRAANALQDQNARLDILAQEQQELNARLQAQAEEKRHFVNMVIHDLRHPLTTMRTALQLLKIETNARQKKAHLSALENRTRALGTLLDELILYDQIEAGQPRLRIEMTDVKELIHSCMAEVSGIPGIETVPIRCEVASDLGALPVDAGKLRHILLNLLANAIRFTREGYIAVRARRRDEDAWCLEVEDTGIGMTSVEKQRAFEEYFSGEQSSVEGDDGTEYKGIRTGIGLGLSITKRLCQALNAEVTLTSTPGEGTHFCIVIPHLASDEAGTDQQASKQS